MKPNFDIRVSPSLLLRVPAYSFKEYGRPIQCFLDDPYFRAAILVASKSLYQELEKAAFDAEKLTRRPHTSLKKYINRACFRPTPFGLFSGVAPLRWGNGENRIELSDRYKAHTSLSFELSCRIAEQAAQKDTDGICYSANASLYEAYREYRFLQCITDAGDKKFIVGAIEKTKVLTHLLRYGPLPCSKTGIMCYVQEQFAATSAEIRNYIDQLIAEEVLQPAYMPGITGGNFLRQVPEPASEVKKDATAHRILSKLDQLSQWNAFSGEENGVSLAQLSTDPELQNITGKSAFYVVTERELKEDILPETWQEKILDGIYCARHLVRVNQPPGLKEFAEGFVKKFDQQWLPLMKALDPELGIAYQSLAVSHSQSALIEGIGLKKAVSPDTAVTWGKAHTLLIGKMQSLERGSPLVLTEKDLSQFSQEDAGAFPFCPTMSVMFRLTGEDLFIEQAGGPAGTALIGRFTPFSGDIYGQAKAIADREMNANPDVIFAEIVHAGEAHAANIERRQAIYPFEIPVQTGSGVPSSYQIPLSDLFVSVQGKDIILWSKKWKKRVIPRLSSAYNHQRSELSVFRFLCDLQYQGIQYNVKFELSELFPDLKHYPRVQYKNTILSLAAWTISPEQLAPLFQAGPQNQVSLLRTLFVELAIPPLISMDEHDHQLVFDTRNDQEMQWFLQLADTGKPLLIREYPFAYDDTVAVANGQEQPFSSQFVATLFHTEKVYSSIAGGMSGPQKARRKFAPGSEWLYLKIYCHPAAANALLTGGIAPFIRESLKMVKQYFFVRYNDPGYHLRVRLHIDPTDGQQLIRKLHRKLGALVNADIISEFSVATYQRELERYDGKIIDETESFFCASSALVLNYLNEQPLMEESPEFFRMAFLSLDLMTERFGLPPDKRERMFRFLAQSFAGEFKLDEPVRRQIKQKYRMLKASGVFDMKEGHRINGKSRTETIWIQFDRSLKILKECVSTWPLSRQISLLSDLIHMHLNRLFTDLQREQELVLYHCLSDHYYSLKQRESKQQSIVIFS